MLRDTDTRFLGLSTRLSLIRLPKLTLGLVLFGVGLAMGILGDYGLPSWDVLHQGIAKHTPLSIGVAGIVTGAVVLTLVVSLAEPIGLGTVLNVIVIGLSVDGVLWLFDDPTNDAVRVALTLAGPVVVAIGSGLYIGVRMGPGPRDGLMTALERRGVAIWKARMAIEAAALTVGFGLGGTIGWGTVWFMVVIGPAVQLFMTPLATAMSPEERGGALAATR